MCNCVVLLVERTCFINIDDFFVCIKFSDLAANMMVGNINSDEAEL